MKKSEIKSIINEVVLELYNNLAPPRKVAEAEIPKQMDGTPDWNKLDRDWETLCNKLTDKLAQQKAKLAQQKANQNPSAPRQDVSGQQGKPNAAFENEDPTGLGLDELHGAPRDGWTKFTSQMGDEREEATKIAAGNSDLEDVFHTAISDGEDTAKPMDQINYGVYTSENFMVEVDLHKRMYRVTKLDGHGRLTHRG